MTLFTSLKLANGAVLNNRICKAAMEENMAEYGQIPGDALINLYGRWADGQPGMILTGNVMVAPDAMTGPAGVYLGRETLDDASVRDTFKQWSAAGKRGGSQLFMQISHPGRQVYATMKTDVVSASATQVQMEGMAQKMFVKARALSEPEIWAMITRFADTAEAAEASGFDGVEIHAAHGYLVAQFLSPLTNLRDDQWGGSLKNRARILLEIIRAVRARTSPKFGIGVKLNSADFQRGGFDVSDAKKVVTWLNDEAVDFVELSGGSYESSAMMGEPTEGELSSTETRELYFFDFAKDISEIAKMPLMVTGGVTKRETAEEALADAGVEIVGIARAFGFNDIIAKDWEAGRNLEVPLPEIKSKNKMFKVLALMSLTKENLYRMGTNKAPRRGQSPLIAVISAQMRQAKQTKIYRKWLESREDGTTVQPKNTRVRRILLAIVTLIVLVLAYLMFWPVPISPVVWDAPENPGYTNAFAPNSDLTNLELINIGDVHGPEDVVAQTTPDGIVLYTSSQEGKIIKIAPDMSASVFAETGGVPLGMELDARGNLIVADAYRGLLSIAPDGTVTTLANRVDGTPILYADDLDIGPDGVIYFSDASTKFGAEAIGETMRASLLEILEHGRTGRLLAYDPATQDTRVIAKGFSFANGVAMGPDTGPDMGPDMGPNNQSVLLVETGEYRIHRIWVSGPKSGESEIILDTLPGFPDNINRGPDGTYLLGLISQRSEFLDDSDKKPDARKLVLRLPQWLQPKVVNYGLVFQIDIDGNVLKTWQDPQGAYIQTTGAVVADDGYMYISSLGAPTLARRTYP